MMKFPRLALLILLLTLMPALRVEAITGVWRGSLQIGPQKLPLIFHFPEPGADPTQCTLDSPNQGATDIRALLLYNTADSVSLVVSSIGMSYGGRLSDGVLTGTFRQHGYTFPLTLTPDAPLAERRPQMPQPPFPYTTIDTTFLAADSVAFGGTITLPDAALYPRPVAAVVMVSGSGQQNRDEELFEHRPFAVIADYLARYGIASLRYDDRGTAQSGGDFATSTIHTFKSDAEAAISFMRSLGCCDKVGILGHSEGGTIAMMLGAEGVPDFIISIAGMAESGKETILRQNEHALASADYDDEFRVTTISLLGSLFDEIAHRYTAGVSEPIDIYSIASRSGKEVPDYLIEVLKGVSDNRAPWLGAILTLDPRTFIGQIKCPILALNGDKDTQVDPDNLTVIKELAPHAQVLLMPGLNHLMQPAGTGEVDEYTEIPITIAPEVLSILTNFTRAQ